MDRFFIVVKYGCIVSAALSGIFGFATIVTFFTNSLRGLQEGHSIGYIQDGPDQNSLKGATILSLFSGIVLIVSIIGCIACFLESDICLIWIYAVVMIMILIGNYVFIHLTFAEYDVQVVTRNYLEFHRISHRKDLKDIHKKYECCGIESPNDLKEIPKDCVNSDTGAIFKTGCMIPVKDDLYKQQVSITALMLTNILLEITAVVFATTIMSSDGYNK